MNLIKTVFLIFLILFVIITSLTHAMNPPSTKDIENNAGYNICIKKMMEAFRKHIDEAVTVFVEKAIRDFHISQIPNMDRDVKLYYKSLYLHLSPNEILNPDVFCDDFHSEESNSYERLEANLRWKEFYAEEKGGDLVLADFIKLSIDDKKSVCKNNLRFFRMAEKLDILREALYNRRQANFDDIEEGITKHKPDTYEYFYLEDIGQRVTPTENFISPKQFCYNKYLKEQSKGNERKLEEDK